jgi:branched-chain amino acid transport system substrate-binding protein
VSERDTGDVVKAAGGKVLGSVKHPLNTPDFSSFLLQAQASKPKSSGSPTAAGILSMQSAGRRVRLGGGKPTRTLICIARGSFKVTQFIER